MSGYISSLEFVRSAQLLRLMRSENGEIMKQILMTTYFVHGQDPANSASLYILIYSLEL